MDRHPSRFIWRAGQTVRGAVPAAIRPQREARMGAMPDTKQPASLPSVYQLRVGRAKSGHRARGFRVGVSGWGLGLFGNAGPVPTQRRRSGGRRAFRAHCWTGKGRRECSPLAPFVV
jgi:hypothetical protein